MARIFPVAWFGHGALTATASFCWNCNLVDLWLLAKQDFSTRCLGHFYDGFSLRAGISIRSAALVVFDLLEDELSNDLIVFQAAVVDGGWIDHQEQPVDQNAPEADGVTSLKKLSVSVMGK